MPILDPKFVILAAAFNLVGSSSYVIETLKGKARPNRVTWFMWALAPLVAFAAERSQQVGLQSLMTFMVGFGPLLVLLSSFISCKAYWKITSFDLLCGALSLLGVILWAITRTSTIAIAFSIASDATAALPTLLKSFTHPESESSYVFIMAAISAVITLLTVSSWSFATVGFPIYIFIICSLLSLVITLKIGQHFQFRKA